MRFGTSSCSALACAVAALSTAVAANATAAPAGTAAEAAAEPLAAPHDDVAGDIIVTATRREQSLNSVAMSITALTGAQLTDRGITTTADLVKVTPGLTFVQSSRSVPVLSLRGVGFFDTSFGARPTVTTYIDQAPIPFSIESAGALFDLERVEVLKGPQGTLFGSNTTGGLINFIAAKPTDSLKAGASVDYGRFNAVDGQAFISGPITSTLRARFALREVISDGTQYSLTRSGDTLGRQRFTQGRLLFDWQPADRLSFALNLNGYYDGSDTQAAQLVAVTPTVPALLPRFSLLGTSPVGPNDNRAADWDAGGDYRRHNGFYQINLRSEYEFSPAAKVTSLTSYAKERINQYTDVDGTSLANYNVRDIGTIEDVSEELRVSGKVGPAIYTVGGSYAEDITHQRNEGSFPYSTNSLQLSAFSTPPGQSLTDLVALTDQRFDTTSVFGNVDLDFLKVLTAHAGARYSRQILNYDACTQLATAGGASSFGGFINFLRARHNPPLAPATLLPFQCASYDVNLNSILKTGRQDEDNVSWHAGLDYKPAEHQLLYASVSKGYKAGSVQNAIATVAEQYTPATQESLVSYELGAKLSLFARTLSLNAAAFHYDYTNKQVLGRAVTVLGAFLSLVNIPKSRVNGAEAQAIYTGFKGLTLTAGATYLDTKVTSTFSNFDIFGNPANFTGNAFPYTPKWQVTADGQYDFPLGRNSAFVGATANYRSSTTAGFGGNPLTVIGAYTLLDLRAGLDLPGGRLRIELYGRNVTNAFYVSNILRVTDVISRFTGTPVTYGGKVTFRY